MLADARSAAQFALGIVFGLSTAGKLRDPKSFARGVRDFQIVPASLAYPVATLIILLEAWLAVSHFTGWRLAVSALLAIGMFLSFTLAVGLNLRRGRRLPCHCFGGRDQELISGQTLVRLALLLICEVFVLNGSGMLASSRPSDLHVLDGPGLDVILFWGPFLLIGGSWLLSLPNVVYLLWPHIPEKGSGG
ncbi:MAG: hypothetical protein DME36_14290 [Verrucomicrobia bacterium]|nr:MAG: hypothetical protein DME36_14290 [Verrucomicrobiota bacterium]